MILFVFLRYLLVAPVTIYFESSINNIIKIYCNKRLYWILEIYIFKITYYLNTIMASSMVLVLYYDIFN
jgi:hypothetical protein